MSRVLLIKNANLYDPDPKGIRDILIVDEKVFSVAEHIDPPELSAPVEVVSADGKMVIPGYVDQHVHVIGGGGAKLLSVCLKGAFYQCFSILHHFLSTDKYRIYQKFLIQDHKIRVAARTDAALFRE